jgi:hypothetical protein
MIVGQLSLLLFSIFNSHKVKEHNNSYHLLKSTLYHETDQFASGSGYSKSDGHVGYYSDE